MTRRSKIALAIAVATGTVGSTLITAGASAFNTPTVATAAACPPGTVLYQTAVPRAVPVPTPAPASYVPPSYVPPSTVPPSTVPPSAVTTDPADPYVSASIDPDSFICVVPGYGALLAPTPGTAPAAPGNQPAVVPTQPAEVPAQPAVVPTQPQQPVLPAATPAPTPTPALSGITGPAPGMIPTDVLPNPPAEPVQPRGADSGAAEPGDRGPNDGGERPDTPQKGDDDDDKGKRITRDEVIGRAVSWILQGVPYSQTSWWTDSNGTYRQDCSGYVSMAWNLNQRTNYWTGNLASVSHRIATKSMKPGDILLLPRSHVVIFAGWANSAKTKFHLYEEYSRGRPARYVTSADLGYYLNRGYGAYRYDRIADVGRGTAGPHSTVYELAVQSTEQADDPMADPSSDSHDGVTEIAAQVPGEPWSPDLAIEAETESVAPAAQEEQVTPEAVPEVPIETLVEVQLATDLRALPADEPAGSGSATALLAAGIGLLFLGFPLAAAAKAGVWLPSVPARREEPTS